MGGKKMKTKFFVGVVLLFLAGCAGSMSLEQREEMYGKTAPEITQAFASKEMKLGDSWKIYLNAFDPDADMKTIVCILSQTGVGTYPVSLIRIPEDQQRDLSGFIFLNTLGGPQDLESQTLTLTVQIQDKARHFSKASSFPLTFNPRGQQQNPPLDVFKDKDLGPISIVLKPLARGD
jgi:hypothetical protein